MRRRLMLSVLGLFAALTLSGCAGLDFSPDGKQIVATTVKGIAILNTDGTNLQLLPEGKDAWMASWSPDGKHILFVKHEDQNDDLMLYDTQTRKTRKIGSNYEPTFGWREDGKRFAAIHRADKGQEAVLYDLVEDAVTLRVALNDVFSEGLGIVWIPNSDNIALLAGHQDERDVYTIESGEFKKITSTKDVIGLDLFANGKKLIWARKSANTKYILCTIYVYDLDKRNVARLPFPERVIGLNAPPKIPPTEVAYVSASPAGDRISLVVAYVVGKKPSSGQEIKYSACWTVKLDGSEAKQIYRTPAQENGGGIGIPVWSKDGGQIAVLEGEEKKLKIAIFRSDGTGGRRILDQNAE